MDGWGWGSAVVKKNSRGAWYVCSFMFRFSYTYYGARARAGGTCLVAVLHAASVIGCWGRAAGAASVIVCW